MSLMRRAPPLFCCSSSSSICPADNKPSSTSASAMRSPNDLTLAMALTERGAEVGDQVGGRRQIPQQPVRGGFSQILHCLLIKRIGGCHQNGFAHPVERQHTPAAANFRRKAARQVNVHIVLFQRQKRRARPVGQQLEGFFHGENLFLREGLDERFG